jgi:hypothetical protein
VAARPIEQALVEKYQLLRPVDPASPIAPEYKQWRGMMYAIPGLETHVARTKLKERIVFVQFDLDEPPEPQFRLAEAHFIKLAERRNLRKRRAQWQPEHWLRYLRLLDAAATGATREQIASVLYPLLRDDHDRRTLHHHLTKDRSRARGMCDGGYRRLPPW